jgi:hypothetical protein
MNVFAAHIAVNMRFLPAKTRIITAFIAVNSSHIRRNQKARLHFATSYKESPNAETLFSPRSSSGLHGRSRCAGRRR